MTQRLRRAAFKKKVKELSGTKPHAQYGVSNSAHLSQNAVRIGIPNLERFDGSSGGLVVISEFIPEPGVEVHVGIEVSDGEAVSAWLDDMSNSQDDVYKERNNNVAVFLNSEGRIFLHNGPKMETHGDDVQRRIGEAGDGFHCDRVFLGIYASKSWKATAMQQCKWLVEWVGATEVHEVSLHSGAPSAELGLADVVDEFAEVLEGCGISYGDAHLASVRAFLVSLITKRFAILTGLSGSGKTQIALRLGKWLGKRRSRVIPVRPDWTGPEHLLGYEDVLRSPSDDGRNAWHVPEALEFMFCAAEDPERAYLLLLDEMNLAHVERYFADILSGMESGEPCLPNLRDENGTWRRETDGESRMPLPENLFVVGTVNVDETTYMFSPKVLDRANTFEFRVQTDELTSAPSVPDAAIEGGESAVSMLLEVATDVNWHFDHPHPDEDTFVEHLKQAHAILSEGDWEFGHRVFREAIRFAAILSAAGESDWKKALDLQIVQKILPRIHGSRRQVESTLLGLARFCLASDTAPRDFDPLDGEVREVRFPIAYEKLRRMIRRVRMNQFVSFAE